MSRSSELRFWRRVGMCAHRVSIIGEHYEDCGECCWPWQGVTNERGYGRTRYTFYDQDEVYAHRVAWRFAHGGVPLQEGMEVAHSCDNPSCCNPSHIEARPHSKTMGGREERGGRVERRGGLRPRKLTWERVVRIRELGREGVLTQAQIASRIGAEYGAEAVVSAQMISDILSGRSWGRASEQGKGQNGKEQ